MASPRSPFAVLFSKSKDDATDRNFKEVQKHLDEMHPLVKARSVGPVDVVAGANYITVPTSLPKPFGRLVVYQSAASDFYDDGMSAGKWVLFSSAPCTIKLLFF